MRIKVFSVGACGNKVLEAAIKAGVISEEDSVMINSTSKDFPKDFNGQKIIISPTDVGAGKERHISKAYLVNSIKEKVFDKIDLTKYSTVAILTSTAGGTGSGSAPMLASYVSKVLVKNVHIVNFTGFQSDIRELANTVEFFKELDENIIVHNISNLAFLEAADGNQTRAEELANNEFVKQFKVWSGQLLIPGDQNIDDTDIIKLSNTYGYTLTEYKELDKSIGDSSDYDKIIKRMIYESKSIQSTNPCPTRIGVILNLKETSQDALGDEFAILKDHFGMPYECFKHIQYDGKKEYIAYIVAGMKMPIDELTKIYDKYLEQSKLIDKQKDSFFDSVKEMTLLDEDEKFNMIKPVKKGISAEDFLANL